MGFRRSTSSRRRTSSIIVSLSLKQATTPADKATTRKTICSSRLRIIYEQAAVSTWFCMNNNKSRGREIASTVLSQLMISHKFTISKSRNYRNCIVAYTINYDGGSDLKVHNDTIPFICCIGATFDTMLFGSLYRNLSQYYGFVVTPPPLGVLNIKERREEVTVQKNRASSIIWFQKILQKTNYLRIDATFTWSVIRDHRLTGTVIRLGKHYLKSARNPSIAQSLLQPSQSPSSQPSQQAKGALNSTLT